MRARSIYLMLVISLYSSICISKLNISKIPPYPLSWAFRCRFSIFTSEYLEQATVVALSQWQQTICSIENCSNGPPQIRKENGGYFLWPLIDPINSWENGHLASSYYLVLGGEVLGLVGVIERYSHGKEEREVKCVQEYDLSRLQNLVVSGFQCPHKTYSRDAIERGIRLLNHLRQKVDKNPRKPKSFPKKFDGTALFNIESLFVWPILPSGTFNYHVLTSLVVDENNNFIGMVHRRNDKYLRCKVTSYTEVKPTLINSNIMQGNLLGPGEIDVFYCRFGLIRSDYALHHVTEAVNGFTAKITDRNRKFPALYTESSDIYDPENLYLWPIDPNGLNIFKFNSRKFRGDLTIFLVITDFSDIIGVVNRLGYEGEFEACERKSISESMIQTYLENYS